MSAQLTSEEIGLLRDSASKACTLLKALANEDRRSVMWATWLLTLDALPRS